MSDVARRLIEDPVNERFLSVTSLWKMAIKVSLGKLKLALPFTDLVEREVRGNAVQLFTIRRGHLEEPARLPFHYRDPFDRLIVTQSISEGGPISTKVTEDEAFANYPVELLWRDDVEHR